MNMLEGATNPETNGATNMEYSFFSHKWEDNWPSWKQTHIGEYLQVREANRKEVKSGMLPGSAS